MDISSQTGEHQMELINATRNVRLYLPNNFNVTVWSKLKPYFSELEVRTISNSIDLENWIYDRNEFIQIIKENLNWRYIKITVNSEDEKANEAYNYAIQKLVPMISKHDNALDKKLTELVDQFSIDPKFDIFLRSVKNNLKLYSDENTELISEAKIISKQFGQIFSKISIQNEGEDLTIQAAGSFLESLDRTVRETIYNKIYQEINENKDDLNDILDELISMRHEIAKNAGFNNYRDYKFMALGRFDYEIEDCFDFHLSIKEEVIPLVAKLHAFRKKSLDIQKLRPWDLAIDITGGKVASPFDDIDDLINKTTTCIGSIDPFFGEVVTLLKEKNHLDLDSRKGKRPGGYNMPLPVSNIPFVFMNAVNSIKDVRTMIHESGHAVHSVLVKDFKLGFFKRTPSEVAELASMTMELLSMEHWDVFFPNKEDLRKAKIWQLEKVLITLPWVATIDKFQHWIYANPTHSQEERKEQWLSIFGEFSSTEVDWSGMKEKKTHLWQRQLHIFEVPFYYIEYGMAQLGAIAIWRNYKNNPTKTLEQYKAALKLGYTKTIPEIYETAGITFDFSTGYVKELIAFIKDELNVLMDS